MTPLFAALIAPVLVASGDGVGRGWPGPPKRKRAPKAKRKKRKAVKAARKEQR